MIKIKMGNLAREERFVELFGGEISGQMFTSFPIKGITRKVYKKRLWRVVNPPA